jgi:hypothetical protein
MKTVLIKQKAGLGDILFTQKIAYSFKEKGHEVIWPVTQAYNYISEYLPTVSFVNIDDDFPFKSEYNNTGCGQIREFNSCIVAGLDGTNTGSHGVMRSKYVLASIDYSDWTQYAKIKRNIEREEKLIEILKIDTDQPFIFVNRQFGTPPNDCAVNNFFKINSDLPVVELQYLENVRVFDWMGILSLAKEIHTVDTALSYILHIMNQKNVFLYPRWKEGDTWMDLSYCNDYYDSAWQFCFNSYNKGFKDFTKLYKNLQPPVA